MKVSIAATFLGSVNIDKLAFTQQFGKQIQAQQVPGWSNYYLDYKFLKKIISSLAANRPASEAAALALGVRPHDPLITPSPESSSQTRRSPAISPANSPAPPPFFAPSGHDLERGPDFRAHKAAFFFKLERELEKVCRLTSKNYVNAERLILVFCRSMHSICKRRRR